MMNMIQGFFERDELEDSEANVDKVGLLGALACVLALIAVIGYAIAPHGFLPWLSVSGLIMFSATIGIVGLVLVGVYLKSIGWLVTSLAVAFASVFWFSLSNLFFLGLKPMLPEALVIIAFVACNLLPLSILRVIWKDSNYELSDFGRSGYVLAFILCYSLLILFMSLIPLLMCSN
jgi:hypothetical protein